MTDRNIFKLLLIAHVDLLSIWWMVFLLLVTIPFWLFFWLLQKDKKSYWSKVLSMSWLN